MTSSSLAKIVFGALENEASGAGVVVPTDVDVIGAGDVFGVGGDSSSAKPDEGGLGIGLLQGFPNFGEVVGEFGEGGGTDPGGDGNEVGDEGDRDFFAGCFSEFLLDFRKVTVAGEAVGADAFIDLGEDQREVGFAPGSTGSAHRGDRDGFVIDEALTHERD